MYYSYKFFGKFRTLALKYTIELFVLKPLRINVLKHATVNVKNLVFVLIHFTALLDFPSQ